MARDESNCSPLFSSEEQLPFCAVGEPSRWAPLYFLTNPWSPLVYGDTPGRGEGLGGNFDGSSQQTQFFYTSESAFGEAAMSHLVREPNLALLATDPGVTEELAVCPPRALYVAAVLLWYVGLGACLTLLAPWRLFGCLARQERCALRPTPAVAALNCL